MVSSAVTGGFEDAALETLAAIRGGSLSAVASLVKFTLILCSSQDLGVATHSDDAIHTTID